MFCLFVDVDVHSYLSASTALYRLFVNISIHSFTLHCGKQFYPYLAANCRWTSALVISSDSKKCTTAFCLSLVQTSGGTVIFMPCSLSTNRLRLNHTRSMPQSGLELQRYQTSAVFIYLFIFPRTQRGSQIAVGL
jgi:hypothetical protein